MRKDLEALEVLKLLKDFVLEFIENGLDRRFVIGSCNILEKHLKALEIIKGSIIAKPNIPQIKVLDKEYVTLEIALSLNDWDLLKEVLYGNS